MVTVPNGTGVAGLQDFTDTRFPQLTPRNNLFFEGQPTAGQQTSETFAYDSFGNVTNYADLGDAGTAAVFSAINPQITYDNAGAAIHQVCDCAGRSLHRAAAL